MPAHSTERWREIDRIFAAALDRPSGDRDAFLRRACGGDAELRSAVESLLESTGPAAAAFGESAAEFAAPLLAALPAEPELEDLPPGSVIGAYRIVREIGRGGMGAVYRAERADRQFEKRVALKVVKRGMDTDEVLRRFRYERQILARLEHPGIARLYDGGVTPDGRPYLVMEFVAGQPLPAYCDALRLPPERRVALVRAVCEAVQFAHQNLIVHRDIKPSNILVTADGAVKLLDFGVAKLLTPGEEEVTRTELRAMTPEYASPEQARGEPVTTASDVYALGVVLHELLCGRRPAAGGTSRLLRGDLEAIVRKALEPQPRRRYSSARELADDLGRYLDGLPVQARRPTPAYRARRYVARHRVGVAAALGVATLGIGFAVFYSVRITGERDRAQAQAAKARATVGFMTQLFEGADPDRAQGDTLNVFELLERGASLERSLAEHPDVHATLQRVLGTLYAKLGDYDRAAPLLEQALATRRRRPLDDPEELVEAERGLGGLVAKRGAVDRADTLYRMAIAAERRRAGDRSPGVAALLDERGIMLARADRLRQAEPLFHEALAILGHAPGDHRAEMATSWYGLGLVSFGSGMLERAESLFRKVLVTRRELYGSRHREVIDALEDLGNTLVEEKRPLAAEPLYREALEQRRRVYGPGHPAVATALDNLGFLLRETGEADRADSLLRESLAITERRVGRIHRNYGATRSILGWVSLARGLPDSAEAQFREALGIMERASGARSADAALLQGDLAAALRRRHRYVEAERRYRESLAIWNELEGAESMHVAWRQWHLADLLRELGRYAEAEQLFRSSLAIRRRLVGPDDLELAQAQWGLGRLLCERRRFSEADSAFGAAIELYRRHGRAEGEAYVRTRIGACLTMRGRYGEAESLLVAGYRVLSGRAANRDATREALGDLVALYRTWGRRSQAARYAALLRAARWGNVVSLGGGATVMTGAAPAPAGR